MTVIHRKVLLMKLSGRKKEIAILEKYYNKNSTI